MRRFFSGYIAILFLFSLSSFVNRSNADIALPKLFSDHMVLQQNQSMRIHGTADAGEELSVSFRGQQIPVTANQTGKWTAVISTGKAGGPFQLEVASINAETKVVFNDVLVGEVWICGGQSNMRFPVRMSAQAKDHIESSKNFPAIRGYNVRPNASAQPLTDFSAVDSWFCCSPESIKDFSAVAYLFGRELNKELDVPIGLIQIASAGTTLEAWTPYDTLESDGRFEQLLKHWNERNEPSHPNRVSNSYNAMVAPLAGFAFRGVIWYQGEANVGRGAQYRRMFPLMIESWREKLGQPDCPFFFVQPTPFRYEERPVEALPEIWDAQLKTLNSVSGTGMVVATDLGSEESNQPVNKLPIAQRLSYWAFAQCYSKHIHGSSPANDQTGSDERNAAVDTGQVTSAKTVKDQKVTLTALKSNAKIAVSGPIFESARRVNSQIVIKFKMADGGLLLNADLETGFTICGPDRRFVKAQVRLNENEAIVFHPEIGQPLAVRFGWKDTARATLRNAAGLPASPFRTDEFRLISEGC